MTSDRVAGYEIHPACALFPLMSDYALEEFTSDVREHGLLEPIVLYEGRVLDGRNRLLACEKAGVQPRFKEWDGAGSPTSWTLSINIQRRHLAVSQRAMIAANSRVVFEAEARQRQLGGLKRGDQPPVSCNESSRGKTAEHAALAAQVSTSSVECASRVFARGVPELVEAVQQGHATVRAAASVATMPDDEQRKLVAAGEKAMKAAAKQIREHRAKGLWDEEQAKPAPCRVWARDGLYDAIVIDSWPSDRGAMTIKEVRALPVLKLAQAHCVLWLWAPIARIRDAIDCLAGWHFNLDTILTWDTGEIGPGRILREATEHCVVGTRGHPVVALERQTTILRAPRSEGSRRPDAFYRLVEELCPGSKLEMLVSRPRDGWASWNDGKVERTALPEGAADQAEVA